jgi:hypothetical protein
MSDRTFTQDQPSPGECVLICSHSLGEGVKTDWWRTDMEFARPDGTTGQARWLAQCVQLCAPRVHAGGEPLVDGDLLWPSDARTADGEAVATPFLRHPPEGA